MNDYIRRMLAEGKTPDEIYKEALHEHEALKKAEDEKNKREAALTEAREVLAKAVDRYTSVVEGRKTGDEKHILEIINEIKNLENGRTFIKFWELF